MSASTKQAAAVLPYLAAPARSIAGYGARAIGSTIKMLAPRTAAPAVRNFGAAATRFGRGQANSFGALQARSGMLGKGYLGTMSLAGKTAEQWPWMFAFDKLYGSNADRGAAEASMKLRHSLGQQSMFARAFYPDKAFSRAMQANPEIQKSYEKIWGKQAAEKEASAFLRNLYRGFAGARSGELARVAGEELAGFEKSVGLAGDGADKLLRLSRRLSKHQTAANNYFQGIDPLNRTVRFGGYFGKRTADPVNAAGLLGSGWLGGEAVSGLFGHGPRATANRNGQAEAALNFREGFRTSPWYRRMAWAANPEQLKPEAFTQDPSVTKKIHSLYGN